MLDILRTQQVGTRDSIHVINRGDDVETTVEHYVQQRSFSSRARAFMKDPLSVAATVLTPVVGYLGVDLLYNTITHKPAVMDSLMSVNSYPASLTMGSIYTGISIMGVFATALTASVLNTKEEKLINAHPLDNPADCIKDHSALEVLAQSYQ